GRKKKSVEVASEETIYMENLNLADDDEILCDLANLENIVANCFMDIDKVHFLETFKL
ncbi:25506_t:CDS:2, partial [Dentiscutata erythropus]